jgi:pyrroline-5-carboxylate reductase
MQKLGLQMGLNDTESKETVQQTLLSAIDLFYNSGLSSK